MPKVKVNLPISNGLRPNDILKFMQTKNISIKDFFSIHEKFMLDKRLQGLSERTLEDHIKHMRFLKEFVEGEKRFIINPKPINADFLKQYMAYMVIEKQYMPCTINIRVATLKCYCNWLYQNHFTGENYSLILKKVRVPEDSIHPLTITEVKKMLSAPDKNTYAGIRDFSIMILILDTGIRVQELSNTLITDIDFANKLLTVRGVISKTRQERRLPLSKQSIILMKQLVNIAEENKSEYVFMSSQTCKKIDYNIIIKNFEKYGKKVSVDKRCTPHVFRHTFAVTAVRKGMNVFYLQKVLGHNQISTTRQYVQLDTADLKREHDRCNFIDGFLKGDK